MSETRTITLSPELAARMDSMLASGLYESEDDIIDAGLDALMPGREAFEKFLRDEVLPVYDAMKADPGRGLTLEQVTANIQARHIDRLKNKA